MQKKVVFVLGPTGSGKTSLAVKLAKRFNGEIISADSRQVYLGLDIGSGKDLEEYQDVKYHLIDVCTPEEKFTLFDWLKLARKALREVWDKGKLPIVVGGTGLYAKSLAEGFCIIKNSKIKNQNFGVASRRSFSRTELDKMTLEQLQDLIKQLKIDCENLDLKNPRRLIRAIEKAQEGTVAVRSKPDFDSLIIAIKKDRSELYKRIDRRVDVRFDKYGMLEEVEDLIKSGVDPDWLKSLGLEYKFITEFIEEGQPKEKYHEMVQQLKYKTHAFARRQLTWLRKQAAVQWIAKEAEAIRFVSKFLNP